MKIARLDNILNDSKHNSIKTITDNTNSTFLETLSQSIAKSTNTKTTIEQISNLQNNNKSTNITRIDALTEENKQIVLKSIDSLNYIFDINILQNKDEFFNEDSQINIRDIIDNYGDNVKSTDLIDLAVTINNLLDNGMISSADYFYALKWIAEKQETFNRC